jgi:hypothetical protein
MIFGAGPCVASQSTGSATSSPSRSRERISASTTGGRWPTAGRSCRAIDDPVGLELLQGLFQPDPIAAIDVEGARDLTLPDLAGSLVM